MNTPFDDGEVQRAIREAIAADKSGAILDSQRAAALAEMYPDNQPLPGQDGDYGTDMMVSLPGQKLGDELRMQRGESDVVRQSQPIAGPPPARDVPSEDPTPAAAAPKEPGGFDFARAFAALGGNLAAFDANRRAKEEGPAKRQLQQQEMMMRQGELQDRSDERKTKLQELRDSMDPASELSKSAADDYARSNAMRAELLKERNPQLAAMFASEAQRALGKSRTQIAQMAKTNESIMGDFGKLVDREVRERMLKGREEDTKADNARADKALAFKTRPRAPAELKVKMPDAKTVEHYNTRTVAMREIDDMLKLLPSVTYTGYGAETANQLASKLPNALDPRTDKDREFVSLLGKLRAKERKEIYGAALSKFDINDAATWLANLGTNKATIEQNLKTLRKALAQTQEETAKNYPKLSGETISDTPPPRSGVQDAPDGARAFSKSAGKYFVRKAGKWVPE